MLQQNFQAHEDQDGTAHHLRLVLILQAKDVAHLQAHGGEDEGDAADEQHRRHDIHPRQQGEGDTHRQCIDAGGHRQQQHDPGSKGGVRRLLVLGEGFLQHIAANDGQQDEGHPVIYRGDILLEGGTQQIAQGGHQRLKASEPRTHDEIVPPLQRLRGQALADRDGEGVHRQPHRNEKQF